MWEVVLTDTSSWYPNGIARVMPGYATQEDADAYREKIRERERPYQGAYVRESPQRSGD